MVEVLLALAIATTGLTVLVAAASSCLAVARRARQFEEAHRLLALIELQHPVLGEIEVGADSGTFPPPYDRYQWKREIILEGEGEEAEEEGLYRVTMTVSWSERGRTASESVVTYVHAPAQKKEGTVEKRGG